MELRIRQAKADDMPAILAVQAEALRKLSKDYYSPEEIEALVRTQSALRVEAFNSGEEWIYVGEVESENSNLQIVVVGALIVRQSYVGGMYVHPAFVRQGLSRQMMQKIETVASQQGRRMLIVASSIVAIPFYKAVGFHHVHRSLIHAESYQIDCAIMTKALALPGDAQRVLALKVVAGFLLVIGLAIALS